MPDQPLARYLVAWYALTLLAASLVLLLQGAGKHSLDRKRQNAL